MGVGRSDGLEPANALVSHVGVVMSAQLGPSLQSVPVCSDETVGCGYRHLFLRAAITDLFSAVHAYGTSPHASGAYAHALSQVPGPGPHPNPYK